MLKVLPSQRPLRRIVPIVIIIVGLILISALVIQQVSAQEARTLKPPFKLIPTDRINPLVSLPPLPLNAPILISETFGANFAPTPSLAGTGWHTVNFSGNLQGYSWGRVFNSQLMTDTAWIAQERFPGTLPALVPGQPYTVNMNSLLIYGPINFSDYGPAVISATYFLDVHAEDSYGLAYSLDGTNFVAVSNETGRDPALGTQRTINYSLPGVARQSTVWLAFYFTSTNHPIDALGVFLDEVVVRTMPLNKNYLPLVSKVYPIPTSTPTPTATPTATPGPSNYRYLYTFTTDTGGNNPDFNRWGGDRTTSCGTNCNYFQSLVGSPNGNPPPAFTLWLQGVNGSGGAGPRKDGVSLSTATNFEYSADVYVYNGQLNARYGLVFDASSGTFPDSGTPPMNTSVNYYLLEMRMDTATRTKVAQWQFLKVTNGGRAALTTAANLPITINQGQWHNLRVTQSGSTLSFYLNGVFLGSTTYDTAWGDSRRRFGLYIDVRDSNGDNGPFEYFSDNITVRDLP